MASKKDRLESSSRHLETNRVHMAREAKKAAKLEKKLRTLTAGINECFRHLFLNPILFLSNLEDIMDQHSQVLNRNIYIYIYCIRVSKLRLKLCEPGVGGGLDRCC